MLKTNKETMRLTLESIAADLRHAYASLKSGRLVQGGTENVAGLIARQIRRVEDLIAVDDGGGASQRRTYRYFVCPLGCGYMTGASGDADYAARNALAAHLQRLKHGMSRLEAIQRANALDVTTIESPQSADAVARGPRESTD